MRGEGGASGQYDAYTLSLTHSFVFIRLALDPELTLRGRLPGTDATCHHRHDSC